MTLNHWVISFWMFTAWNATSQIRHYGIQKSNTEGFLLSQSSMEWDRDSIHHPVSLKLTFIIAQAEISNSRLSLQVESLNQDFSRQTFDKSAYQNTIYGSLAADTEIRFCEKFQRIDLPKIQKLDSTTQVPQILASIPLENGSIPVFIGDLNGLAGSGYFSEDYLAEDAIFLDSHFLVGSDVPGFTLGKTLTHLLGRYLGLGPLWDCLDDDIADTPLMSAQHFEQTEGWSSCYSHVVYTMPQNFMYNTQDQYLNMFTKGQKDRMWEILLTKRPYLLNRSTCQ